MEEGLKYTVLIVDDDPLISDLLTRKFSDKGFLTMHAGSGSQALKQLEQSPLPDVMLLDITMPNLDGFEVMSRMKENARLSHIPIGVLSNSGKEEDVEKAKELGAKFYMVKIDAPLEQIVSHTRALCKKE
jgi:CheY-like chemotaxis protein